MVWKVSIQVFRLFQYDYVCQRVTSHILTNVGHVVKHASLGDYVKDTVPSLKSFISEGNAEQEYNIPSLAALSSAMRLLER